MKAVLYVVCLYGVLLSMAAHADDIIPLITRDNAIQYARKFFDAVHWNTHGENLILTPTSYGIRKYRWEIISDTYHVQINNNSGKIVYAIHVNALAKRKKSIKNISEKGTQRYVEKYIKATDLSFEDLELIYTHLRFENVQDSGSFWDICYKKTFKKYQYYGMNNVVFFSLDPTDGNLISFDNPGEIPEPKTIETKLSKDEAVTVAAKYFANNGINVKGVASSNLYIVLPNNTWQYLQHKAKNFQQDFNSKLAWVIDYTDGPAQPTEIWVDAATGDILGGPKDTVLEMNSPISDDATIHRAADFFDHVHWQWTDVTKLEAPDKIPFLGMSRWKLDSGVSHIEIDSNTGAIRRAVNYDNLKSNDQQALITKDVALHLAEQYLQAAGISLSDIKLIFIAETKLGPAEPGEWKVIFRRIYKGYEYSYENTITVNLRLKDGSLISFGDPNIIPEPSSVQVKVSMEDATAAAFKYFNDHKIAIQRSMIKPSLLIVRPDNYWDFVLHIAKQYRAESYSKLAWIISVNGPWPGMQIWIDAADGTVLGGVKNK